MSAVGRNGSAIAGPPSNGTAATISVVDLGDEHLAARADGAVQAGEPRQRRRVLRRGAAEDEALAEGRGRGLAGLAGGAGGGGGGVAVGHLGGGDVGVEGLHGVSRLVDLRHALILGYAAPSYIGRMERVLLPGALVAGRPALPVATRAYEPPFAASISAWRSSMRRILPVSVFGSSSTNSILRG